MTVVKLVHVIRRVSARVFAILMSGAIALFAQSPEASIFGTVKDQSGARVANALVTVESRLAAVKRTTASNSRGEFSVELLAPGTYRVTVRYTGFEGASAEVKLVTGASQTLSIVLQPAALKESVQVRGTPSTLSSQPVDSTSSVSKTTIYAKDLAFLPLANRSFANIAYLAPKTAPVEPSDPTKARITAVSFAGSSGLNVDLSVDGGDNNDDYIGGFLQNYSPDAMQDFTVRTSQFDADTSRTNGGSVMISTRRGSDEWHGDLAAYFRQSGLNARNTLDNPDPNPKQPFSRQNGAMGIGGPIVKQRLWFYSTLEYVHEDASVPYSALSLDEFHALAQLASGGLIPGVSHLDVPTSVPVPFRDTLFTTRLDWSQNERSQWFLRGSADHYEAKNSLVQQGTLPSTGAYSQSTYWSTLLWNQYQFGPRWLAILTAQASDFHLSQQRNSNLGFALSFPFSVTLQTTSGFETFGDNQFVTPITAFPIRRDQQKYQLRYDVARSGGTHFVKFGVNFIHEPVMSGELASNVETLVQFPQNPSFYVNNTAQFQQDYAAGSTTSGGGSGVFSQSVRRLGVYAQDSWRFAQNLTLNIGVRYDTTFGLFRASGREQNQNPAFQTLQALGIGLVPGVPHDYRGALAPRIGFAWSPGGAGRTVVRGGAGLYFNDLTQGGWVEAFQAVNTPVSGLLGPGDHGSLIDPGYKTPYALQASLGVERAFSDTWRFNVEYEHHQGVHQYRRYEYVGGVVLPAYSPDISLFRADNRSRYDGVSFQVSHRLSNRFDLSAHYTLASASTWGATVGELFDYVNGVSDARRAFGPGDHGPSGEDVRHRLVLAGTLLLPGKIEVSTLSQFESARPFTLATPVDVNGDGVDTNDRAVVNGRQTGLDEFRGTPFLQVALRVSRPIRLGERFVLRPFAEFFNLFNRLNSGNNYVGSISSLPVPPSQLGNATDFCMSADCTSTRPLTRNDLRVPAGALGDFFGPGTTVGIPFAAQLGLRLSF